MFYNNIFLENINKKNIKFLSIKQLYVLYSIFRKSYLNSNRNKLVFFFINTSLVNKNYNNLYVYTFFTLLFFLKTNNVIFVDVVRPGFKSLKLNNLFFLLHSKNLYGNFSVFWKKWRDLKRPATSADVSSYYLDDFKKKLNIYLNLGFIKLYNKYVILITKTQKSDTLVFFNKSIVNSPKYSSTSISKNLLVTGLNNFEFQFLRKNRVYNKGRYSRTRQNYRTGVYLCMYLSVISIFGLYYWFYRFSFNFTYLWWVFIVFLGSFFFPKIVKYRLYEPTTILNKFFDFFRWLGLLIKSLIS